MSLSMRTIVWLILSSIVPAAFAQDSKLIEAARKEGRLVLYGTMQTDTFELLHKSFHKKIGHYDRLLAHFRHQGNGAGA